MSASRGDFERARVDALALALNTDAFTSNPLTAGQCQLLRVRVTTNVTSVVNVIETHPNGTVLTHGLGNGTAVVAGDDGTKQYDLIAIAGCTYNLQCETAQTANAWGAVMRLVAE